MLTPEHLEIIQASVPLLREHGLTITRLFYEKLFGAHPELKNLFNMSNQAHGDQPQALAAAVYAYAANINNPQALEPVLSRIAHKHGSLGVTPTQYTVVGRHLLAAVCEVLGDLATDAVKAAWNEAYWLLASELIAREARLYQERDIAAGREMRQMRIANIIKENEEIRSFYLESVDCQPLGKFSPGQYVSVMFTDPNTGLRQLRQYSLSDAPNDKYWRITVKLESGSAERQAPPGLVSSLMHGLKQGDIVSVSAPYGDFCLRNKRPDATLVLLSAGVGITPIVSILNHLAVEKSKKPIRFVHAARNEKLQCFKDDIVKAEQSLADCRAFFFYETHRANGSRAFAGRMNLGALGEDVLNKDAEYYICGPLPFMRLQREYLLTHGIPGDQIHYEVFGPDLLLGLQ